LDGSPDLYGIVNKSALNIQQADYVKFDGNFSVFFEKYTS